MSRTVLEYFVGGVLCFTLVLTMLYGQKKKKEMKGETLRVEYVNSDYLARESVLVKIEHNLLDAFQINLKWKFCCI